MMKIISTLYFLVAAISGVYATDLDKFVKVESSGTYTFMSTTANTSGGETTTLPTEYYICKYAVTNAEWKKYVDATGASVPKYWSNGTYPEGRENHPVLWISYEEALAYCKWLSDNTAGWTFRMPSEAEWEYAATQYNAYPWGNFSDASYANGVLTSKFNYNGVIASDVLKTPDRMATYNNSKSTRYNEQDKVSDIISISSKGAVSGWVDHQNYLGFIYTDIFSGINHVGGNTCTVDAYPEGKSWCGCYNMCGNCWEWTSTVGIANNGAEQGLEVNVIRGGSWYATASSCKASFRGEGRKGTSAYNTVGFRLVAVKGNDASAIYEVTHNVYTPKVKRQFNLPGQRVKPRRNTVVIEDYRKYIKR